MKDILLLFLAGLTVIFVGCDKAENSLPPCVLQRIEQIKNQPKWNPPAEIHEYTYEGKQVYLFSSDCCDQYIGLYDNNCNYLCAPSGGITGRGDGGCNNFYTTATYVRLVWKDSR
jgi:hypothetical protein